MARGSDRDLSRYKRYAEDVLSGKIIACRYIRLACERYLSWFGRDDMYFDPDAADRVVNFAAKFKHFTGAFAGKPFVFIDWQEWVVYQIYGFKWKKDGTRVIRRVYLEVSRKNGKSSMAAILSLYALIGDGENNAEVVFASNSAKQAGLCFSMAEKYLKPFTQHTKLFRKYRDSIRFDATDSTMEVVSAEASRLEGKNCSFYICDELAQADNGLVYNTLATSQGMRDQPLSIVITTAGFDRSSFCFEMRQTFINILEGINTSDSSFCAIYTVDEGDDPLTEDKEERYRIWKKSTPNLGITVKPDFIENELNDAKNNPALMGSVLTRYFNLWLSTSKEWIHRDSVCACMRKWEWSDLGDEDWIYAGLDLASVDDLTSITMMVPKDGAYYYRSYYFLPVSALEKSYNKVRYQQWAREGHLIVTPQKAVDYDYIISVIKDINKERAITQISYDPWQSRQLVNNLTNEGFNMKPFAQTIGNMNRPTKELARLIISEKVVMYPNPITLWCFQNAGIKRDWNGNEKLVKGASDNNKIDGCVAMVIALGGYLEEQMPDDFRTINL